MSVAVANRFIERNSTTAVSGFAAIVDWLLAASISLAIVVALAGIDVRIGGVALRSHSAGRVLVASLVLLAVRWRMGLPLLNTWLVRFGSLVAITGSIATWFRFLLSTIGGADSYGYVSASRLIASGHLVQASPIADWLSAANRLAVASPLGWAPAPDASGIVPTYPIGVSSVMALFSLIGGSDAVFLVSPVLGLLTLALVYQLARDWHNSETALFATALVAWNPVFIAYAKQPMSDITATFLMMLSLVLALRRSNATALGAGLAAGAAVITRPVLLVAAAIIPAASYRGDHSPRRVVLAAAGLAVGVVSQLAIQNFLFGSPFSTGYGAAAGLFSIAHLGANLKIFFGYGWLVAGPVWLPGLIIGLFAARPEGRNWPLAIAGAVLLPYLFYLPFDHWETLRFVLPGLVPLTIVAADGLVRIARYPRNATAAAAMLCVFIGIVILPAERLLRASSAWEISSMEARYPLAGEWVNINTPANSVVMANQHSGSLRWYGKRQTIRWDFVDPAHLTTTVRELQSHGATVYVALEGDEVAMFDQKFKAVIDQLRVDHVGSIRNVNFRRLLASE